MKKQARSNKKQGKATQHMYMYCIYPGAKVRVITREARFYAKTRAFTSFYAIISRAHAACAVT